MRNTVTIIAALGTSALLLPSASGQSNAIQAHQAKETSPRARNVILFVGDGMGVSTVTAARIFTAGVSGQLHIDKMPYTALSRTYNADHITPDSAGTITAMMTGVNANMGVIGFGPETEPGDFNKDGDGPRLWTIAELAKKAGMKVGVVTTARVTHATPAGAYAHVNSRDLEQEIALQALPGDAHYNKRLGSGLDILMGGGRQFFVPAGQSDEEGAMGKRADGRDLRQEYRHSGYAYAWNTSTFNKLTERNLPILGLFESSHMKFEYDRKSDSGGEPSLTDMTVKSIGWLTAATSGDEASDRGYFLLVEGGRIDHAHHASNAFRALDETREFDRAVGAAMETVNLNNTLILVTADHSHVFTIAGYPVIDAPSLPYKPKDMPEAYVKSPYHDILDVVYTLDERTGAIVVATDRSGVPYTVLGYANGPGYRAGPRQDPRKQGGEGGLGPNDPSYIQESTVPRGGETHGGEDVVIYAAGAGAEMVHGTVKNTFVFDVMRKALGLGAAVD